MVWHRLRSLRDSRALRVAAYLLCAALVGVAGAVAAEIACIWLWGVLETLMVSWYG